MDELGERSTVFEHAFVQYPSTLVSHASMFTGLYPREHGVSLPGERLSPELELVAERFRGNGFATAAFTEGGFVSASHGFDRGFDEFYERPEFSPDDEIERTFDRGLDFLFRLPSDQRFFLFLHTYSVHDPYEPPEPYRSMFLEGPTGPVESSGKYLREVYMGRATVQAEEIARLRALYDGSVRYVDSVLETFFARLDELGLADETTVILTSDHGEEFGQHGDLGHYQIYPEILHVPLIVVYPGARRGARVATPVQSVDLAPTLFDLAGLPDVELGSGRSLAPAIRGDDLPRREVFAEVFDQRSQLTTIEARDEGLFQYSLTRYLDEPDGTWITRQATFDLPAGDAIEAVSFAERRTLSIAVDGTGHSAVDVGGDWTLLLEPANARRRVKLSTDGCSVPLFLGVGSDSRCLSVKVRGAELRREELFDLRTDPEAQRDLLSLRPKMGRELAERLATRRWTLAAPPLRGAPSPESLEVLRALGYVD